MIDVALVKTKQDNGKFFFTLVNPVTEKPLFYFLLGGCFFRSEEEIREYAKEHGYRIVNSTRKHKPPKKTTFIKHRV